MKRFKGSYIDKEGRRVILGLSWRLFNEKELAQNAMDRWLADKSGVQLADIFGLQCLGTFEVRGFECDGNGEALSEYLS